MNKEASSRNFSLLTKMQFFTLILFIASVFLVSSLLSSRSDFRSLLSFETFKCSPPLSNHNTTDIKREDLETALEETADENKTVILAVVNKAYVEATEEGGAGAPPVNMLDLFLESFWLGEETRPLINNLLIVATDPTAYERCVFRGLHCYLLQGNGTERSDVAGEKVYMSQGFINMMWRRTHFLLTVLRMGYNFIFTDTDVMWLRNPLTILNNDPNSDIQISTDKFNGNPTSYLNNINTGFYMARSNPKTIALFEKWYDAKDNSVGIKEQDVLQNMILRGDLRELNVTVSFLDTRRFSGFCQDSKEPRNVVTVHSNCCRYINAKVKDLTRVLWDWQRFRGLVANESAAFSWSRHVNCWHSWAANNNGTR